MTAFKIMMAVTAMSSALAIFASERGPPKPPAAVADAINARWPDEPPPAKKADRLPLAEPARPLPEPDEAPAQVAVARTDVLQTVGATASARRHLVEHNVCTRHGMHKQVTRGGRSWRCRR